ncbi:MAG: tetratricopeptide repeat protein, partial [Planctomycetota bacterium]|nr:tetratricopeptide repeat protein [Planctomycetota bacterium]
MCIRRMAAAFWFAAACVLWACGAASTAGEAGEHPEEELYAAYGEYRRLEKQGKYAEALPHALRAVELGKKVFGEGHANYATLLYDLAGLYKSMGSYDKAEPL